MTDETGVDLFTGLIRFYSLTDVRKFLKELLESYQKEFDHASAIIGSFLRTDEQKKMEVIMSRGWTRAGSLFVNITDAQKGWMEIVFQHVNDLRPRVMKTAEVLKAFDAVEGLPISEEVTFLLYLRAGVPERLVVDGSDARPGKFNFVGQYDTV
jgi:hypothetical protein